MLQADIDQINALARTLDEIAANVDAIDVRTRAKTVAGGLAGTPLGAACELATEYTEGAWLRTSGRVTAVAAAMRVAADDLAVTDAEFGRRLDEFDYRAPESR
ncbi:MULTISPECIES: hypothetical protein [Nocardia]|uniref:hypothetical protein n=1 Tax=Nocardia TaxID=1817 RepID=UPI000D6890FE|nr:MULTISPECIES: hypothetical protein [Nocardia]